MLQLEWIAEGGSQAGLPAPVVARRKNREKLAWGVAAALASPPRRSRLRLRAKRAPKPPPLVRFEIVPPADVATIDAPRISPDGRLVAFDATDIGREDAHLGPAAERARRRSRSRARRDDAGRSGRPTAVTSASSPTAS